MGEKRRHGEELRAMLGQLPEMQAIRSVTVEADAMVRTVSALLAEGRAVPVTVARQAQVLDAALARLEELGQ